MGAKAFCVDGRPQKHRIGAEIKPKQQRDHGADGAVDLIEAGHVFEIKRKTKGHGAPDHGGDQQADCKQRRAAAGGKIARKAKKATPADISPSSACSVRR